MRSGSSGSAVCPPAMMPSHFSRRAASRTASSLIPTPSLSSTFGSISSPGRLSCCSTWTVSSKSRDAARTLSARSLASCAKIRCVVVIGSAARTVVLTRRPSYLGYPRSQLCRVLDVLGMSRHRRRMRSQTGLASDSYTVDAADRSQGGVARARQEAGASYPPGPVRRAALTCNSLSSTSSASLQGICRRYIRSR